MQFLKKIYHACARDPVCRGRPRASPMAPQGHIPCEDHAYIAIAGIGLAQGLPLHQIGVKRLPRSFSPEGYRLRGSSVAV